MFGNSLAKCRPLALSFYRRALRVIRQLEGEHQEVYYVYLKMKYKENANLRDSKKIKTMLRDAEEELDWLVTVIKRRPPKITG